jgi:hypothetical protein
VKILSQNLVCNILFLFIFFIPDSKIISQNDNLPEEGQLNVRSDFHDYLDTGMLFGKSLPATEVEFFLGNTVTQVRGAKSDIFDGYTYGYSYFRIEGGTGFGIAGHGFLPFSKIGLLNSENDDGFYPHVGIEPFNISFSANVKDEREDFFEWEPMGSGGFQFFLGNFRYLILIRAGGGIGTLGKTDNKKSSPTNFAYGIGNYLIWNDMDLALEFMRIDADIPVDRWIFDSTILKRAKFSIGLKIETLFIRTKKEDAMIFSWINPRSNSEYRFSVILRFGTPKGLQGKNKVPVI